MLVRCQVPERPVFCFRSGAYVSHCCVFRFLPPRFLVNATRTFRIVCFPGIPGRTFRIARFCSFSFWSTRFSFVVFYRESRRIARTCLFVAILAGRFCLFWFCVGRAPGPTFRHPGAYVSHCCVLVFFQDVFFGPGATKCRIGNVKKPTMQDARAGAPNKKS